MQSNWLRTSASVLMLGALIACDDAGPAVEIVDIQMRQTDQIIMHTASGWFASAAGPAAAAVAISPDTVASLVIRVTDIQVLPVGGDEDDDGAWVSLMLPDTVDLDLMALPTAGQSPLVIASGALAVGDYQNVRLFVASATIEFTGPLSLGGAFTFDANVPYDVTIPSGGQTGLKTDAAFSVTENGGTVNDVELLFSTGSTFQNVSGTGTGEVILAPVIRGDVAQGS